jgi:uncharacterized sporulation protein YeaH/YhbH (DUF444 family)
MGITDDKARFDEIGEDKRQDLADYIKHGDLSTDKIKIPIKVVELPEFLYDPVDMGGIGKGDGEPGDTVGEPQPSDEDGDGDEAGDGDGEHGYYEMDPEEFAQELEDELELHLEPKGKTVSEEIEGGYTDIAHTGPSSTLDFDRFFKKTLKRELALSADHDYVRELMKVSGYGPKRVFEWTREHNIPLSEGWVEKEYDSLDSDERTLYESPDEIGRELRQGLDALDMRDIVFREEDKRHRYPRVIKKKERNVVVVNIRDVSGSMRKEKRDLVQRVFTPLDWYLTGKYDKAVFIYIAHDSSAWQVERMEFFGLKSGGGTRISTAYELAQGLLDEEYPWTEWNRYVFAAGDGENSSNDTDKNVIPLLSEVEANLHAYVEVQPSNSRRSQHGDLLQNHFGEDSSDVVVTRVNDKDDVMPAIKEILLTAGSEKVRSS